MSSSQRGKRCPTKSSQHPARSTMAGCGRAHMKLSDPSPVGSLSAPSLSASMTRATPHSPTPGHSPLAPPMHPPYISHYQSPYFPSTSIGSPFYPYTSHNRHQYYYQNTPPPQFQSQPQSWPQLETQHSLPADIHCSSPSHQPLGIDVTDGKEWIIPYGDKFHPNKSPSHNISAAIKKKFNGEYYTWEETNPGIRSLWFKIWEKKYKWLPQDDAQIRRNWNWQAASRLCQMIQRARKRIDKKPDFITQDIWEKMTTKWTSLEYQKKSETTKKNRASERRVSLYTGGSIPMTRRKRKMNECMQLKEASQASSSQASAEGGSVGKFVHSTSSGASMDGLKGVSIEAENQHLWRQLEDQRRRIDDHEAKITSLQSAMRRLESVVVELYSRFHMNSSRDEATPQDDTDVDVGVANSSVDSDGSDEELG